MMMSRGHSAGGAALKKGSSTRSSAPSMSSLIASILRVALLARQRQQRLGAHADLLDARLGADDPHRGLALVARVDEQRDLAVDVGERAADRLDVGEVALAGCCRRAARKLPATARRRGCARAARRVPRRRAHSRRRWRRCRERRSRPSDARARQRPLGRVEILRREQQPLFGDVVDTGRGACARPAKRRRPADRAARASRRRASGRRPLAEPARRAAARRRERQRRRPVGANGRRARIRRHCPWASTLACSDAGRPSMGGAPPASLAAKPAWRAAEAASAAACIALRRRRIR